MGKGFEILMTGLVTIGLATALVLPGRNTANVLKSAGTAGQGLLGTAISGKR